MTVYPLLFSLNNNQGKKNTLKNKYVKIPKSARSDDAAARVSNQGGY